MSCPIKVKNADYHNLLVLLRKDNIILIYHYYKDTVIHLKK